MAHSLSNDAVLGGQSTLKGRFGRVLDRMVEARQRQANRAVRAHLAALDDRTLTDLGFDPMKIRY